MNNFQEQKIETMSSMISAIENHDPMVNHGTIHVDFLPLSLKS